MNRYRTRLHSHVLEEVEGSADWACDGRNTIQGCRKGCTGFCQTNGWRRFSCTGCGFDLCEGCLQFHFVTLEIVNSEGAIIHRGTSHSRTRGSSRVGTSNFYCGRTMNQCRCGHCDGVCGPSNGCPCNSCFSFLQLNHDLANEQSAIPDHIKVTTHPHNLFINGADNGWACDGRRLPGGCRQGCIGFNTTTGWKRYRCNDCDFDLCEGCVRVYAPSLIFPLHGATVPATGGLAIPAPPPRSVPTTRTSTAAAVSAAVASVVDVKHLEDENANLKAKILRLQADPQMLKDYKLEDYEALQKELTASLCYVERAKERCLHQKLEARLCIACQEQEKTVVMMPCRHLTFCRMCISEFKSKICPVCRVDVNGTLDIFV